MSRFRDIYDLNGFDSFLPVMTKEEKIIYKNMDKYLDTLEEAKGGILTWEEENAAIDYFTKTLIQRIEEKANTLKIKVHYKDSAHPLEQIDKGGCIDFYNYTDINLKKGDFTMIDTGVAIGIPDDYDILIFPRSSTFRRYGLLETNSVGYVDNAYRGTNDFIYVPVYATKDIFIPKNTRCFQFRLIKRQPNLEFITVDELEYDDRGANGSTGR